MSDMGLPVIDICNTEKSDKYKVNNPHCSYQRYDIQAKRKSQVSLLSTLSPRLYVSLSQLQQHER